MRDVLPEEMAVRDRALATILEVYGRHGFVRIETPAVEHLALLTRSDGGENEKLIFRILKRGEKLASARGVEELADLGLRFDLTVPLARYYAHNHARLPQPLKAIQVGPVWRAERPQHGRFRQFTQCDIDTLGVASEVAEIELILATGEALRALSLPDLTVRVNDRRVLGAVARHAGFEEARLASVFIAVDKLDKVGRAGVAAELEAAGHPQRAVERLLGLLAQAVEAGPGAPGAALARLQRLLGGEAEAAVWTALGRIIETAGAQAGPGMQVAFDPALARGMGYYTGPIFEVGCRGVPWSIAGGGRYDRMIGQLLGRDVPATGFSIGFERVVSLLLERGGAGRAEPERVALVFDEGTPHLARVLALAGELRESGRTVLLELRGRRPGRQFQDLAARGYGRIGVLREDGSLEWRGSGARADDGTVVESGGGA
jgi:histidyl-tRNA synthetase